MATSEARENSVVVVSKSDLLDTLRDIRKMLEEYRLLIERISDSEDWNREALALLRHHQSQAINGDSPLAKMHLVAGLFQVLVKRVNQEEFKFVLPTRMGLIPEVENKELREYTQQLKLINETTENLIGELLALAHSPQVASNDKLQSLLLSIGSLFKGLIRQDWADVSLFLTHINLITTSRESHQLVGQIAKIARSIYDSLNEFSEGFSMESLSHTTGEIPDAVVKLNSVIDRLEEAANTNLDSLEGLSGQLQEHTQWLKDSHHVIEECERDIERIKSENPAMTSELDAIKEVLHEQIKLDLDALVKRAEEDNQIFQTMMANQSFQDLTGQTLKKVIKFIESLQFKLIELLPNYGDFRVEGQSQEPGAGADAEEEKVGAVPLQSQEKVDQMLADLGF